MFNTCLLKVCFVLYVHLISSATYKICQSGLLQRLLVFLQPSIAPLHSPVALDQKTKISGQAELDDLGAEEAFINVSKDTTLPCKLYGRLTNGTEELHSLCQPNNMANANQSESAHNHSQLATISTINLSQTSQDQSNRRILDEIRVHARSDQNRIVGVAIWLLDPLSLLAILRDGLVALPGVEIDALGYYAHGEEGVEGDEGDCEACCDGQELAKAEDGGCVAHGCDWCFEIGKDDLVIDAICE